MKWSSTWCLVITSIQIFFWILFQEWVLQSFFTVVYKEKTKKCRCWTDRHECKNMKLGVLINLRWFWHDEALQQDLQDFSSPAWEQIPHPHIKLHTVWPKCFCTKLPWFEHIHIKHRRLCDYSKRCKQPIKSF